MAVTVVAESIPTITRPSGAHLRGAWARPGRSDTWPCMLRRGALMPLTTVLFACGGTSSTGTTPTSDAVLLPSATTTTGGSEPSPANELVSITVVERPEDFAFDGAVEEWPLDAIDMGTDPEMPDEPREQEPFVTEGVGKVALVVTSEGLMLAGSLTKDAPGPVWIGVGTRPAALPYIGSLGRAAASFDPIVCSEMERIFTDGMWIETDKPAAPEGVAACRAVVARYDAYVAEQAKRFARVLRVDEKGITDVTTAKATPVPSAKLQWKAGADGARSFEATLGLDAMPRVADAPLMSMRVIARARELTVPASRWNGVFIPGAVDYEPHARLRSELFARLPEFSIPYQAPPGLSFHPTKPDLVESFDYSESEIVPHEGPLWVDHATMGDVRIGRVDVGRSFLASYKGAEFVALFEPIRGWLETTTSQPVARNGEVHLFHFNGRIYGGGMSYEPPGWAVTAVGDDGLFREVLTADLTMPPSPESGSLWWRVEDVEQLSNKSFTEFGYAGVFHENEGEQQATIKWRWDAKKKRYVESDWKLGKRKAK